MRIFVTPLGNLSRLIRKPVSLMLSLLLDDELFADGEIAELDLSYQ